MQAGISLANDLLQVHRIPALDAKEFRLFRELIQRETGISLRESKRALVVTRLSRRLRDLGLESYSQYYEYLSKHDPAGDERRRFINSITTNKTSFFREPHHFKFLREQLVPELHSRARSPADRTLRVWSAACSTGEEPYSIAVTVRDALGAGFPAWDVRILASDIDTDVLAAAGEAVYPLEAAGEVPEALRTRLFLRGIGRWSGCVQIRPEVRSLVTFRRINFIDAAWPVHCRFDAIFCRNAMIYFDRPTQRRLVERLASMLKPAGCLFAGHSENLLWLSDRLVPAGSTVYRLKRGALQ